MKKVFSTPLLCSLLSVLVWTAPVQAKDYSLPLSNPGEPATLNMDVMQGSITIMGYDGQTIEISATPKTKSVNDDNSHEDKIEKQVQKSMEEQWGNGETKRSTKGLSKVETFSGQIEIVEANNEVEISSHNTRRDVAFVIKVPYETSLVLRHLKGSGIRVSDVRGAMELSSHRGTITAEGVVGPIVAETHRKDIEVTFKGLNQETPSSITSHRGSIDVTLNSAVKAQVKVQSHRGDVYSGLDNQFVADEQIKTKTSDGRQHVTMGGMLTAPVNGGGQSLSLITYRGDIYVRK